MTERNDMSDETLSKLYKKRKLSHLAPTSIERKLLKAPTSEKGHTAIFNRISYVAVAASTMLLIGIMLIRNEQFNTPQLNYQTVQIHSLQATNPLSSENIRSRYAQHYKNYLKQQQTYAQHHQKQAKLTVSGNTWELKTCDNELMQISAGLISALTSIQQIDEQLHSGDIVEIAFDQTGIILGIYRTDVPLSC